jgi:type II secretory pathway predicted ATPase ExeA
MKGHKQQAEALKKLGISHRAAARDLTMTSSVLSRYLLSGKVTRHLGGGFVARVDEYLKKKAAGGVAKFQAPLIIGKFFQAATPLRKLSEATGVDYVTLKNGIYHGKWPDESTHKSINQWIDRELSIREGKKMLTQVFLTEDVLEHWNLKFDPFSSEMHGPEDTLCTKELEKIVALMMKTVYKPGWLTITGDVGSGKSTAVREFRDRAAKKKEIVVIQPMIVQKELLGASHVLDAVLQDLGIQDALKHNITLENKARLVHRVAEGSLRDGKRPVILIDESQMLSDNALLCLRRIAEIAVGYQKFTAIILVGQPQLARRLKGNFALTEAAQRTTIHELGSLKGMIGAYLKHKLERAGCAKEIFDQAAIKAIGNKASTPLGVNCVAAAGLVKALELGEHHITAGIIEEI